MRAAGFSSSIGLIEFYSNPAAPVPDYATMPPLMLHLAFTGEKALARRNTGC
jgi:hypothetical protein